MSGTHEAWEGRLGPVVNPPRCRTASHLASRPSLQHASMQATVGRNNPSKALARVKANNGAADGRRSAGRVNHEIIERPRCANGTTRIPRSPAGGHSVR